MKAEWLTVGDAFRFHAGVDIGASDERVRQHVMQRFHAVLLRDIALDLQNFRHLLRVRFLDFDLDGRPVFFDRSKLSLLIFEFPAPPLLMTRHPPPSALLCSLLVSTSVSALLQLSTN